jgi:RimJ/RimL family protein N-acetyltransferase
LHTDRLTLRAPQASDWPAFRDFLRSDRAHFIRPDDIDDGKIWRAFGHVIGMWVLRGYGSFVYTLTGSDKPLGLTGPWFPEGWPEREIGWTVWDAASEGKGIVREAAHAARAYAYGTLGWDTAVSYIDPANSRSIALAVRLGAVLDPNAASPGTDPCLVYRHPAPEAAQ